MSDYDVIGRFYDGIMGDQREAANKVHGLIKKYHPKAKSVLELGCGTGSYLLYLSKYYRTTGVDTSSVMLSLAREKMPDAELYQTSMLDMELGGRFDVIICMNDTINHLIKISDLKKIFSKCYEHMSENGILIFDINTEFKLKNLSESGPIVHQFGDNYFITHVQRIKKDVYEWDLRVFEHTSGNEYRLFGELLYERAYSQTQIEKLLSGFFTNVKLFDLDLGTVSDKSHKLHYVCINE